MQEDLCLTGKKKMADFTVNCKICHLQLYISYNIYKSETNQASERKKFLYNSITAEAD